MTLEKPSTIYYLPTTAAQPLLAIVGQTATGKSALAIEIAEQFNGEIICADSRTVYKSLDIGTAKPTAADRRRVPHHLLDIVEPDQRFTAADFKLMAIQAVNDINRRGKLPILVGGSGLYIDSILFDYQFLPAGDEDMRRELEKLSTEELQERLTEQDIELPANRQNRRHLIRALETGGATAKKKSLRANTCIVGLRLPREELERRIAARTKQMVRAGLVDEVRAAAEKYGWDAQGLQAPAYRSFKKYILGEATLDEAIDLSIKSELQLAKRQLTWFKRNDSIQWLDNPGKYVADTTTLLNKTF